MNHHFTVYTLIKGFRASFSIVSKAKEKHHSCLEDGRSIYETHIEYKESVEVVATIQSYPQDLTICWMKGSSPLKVDDSKYADSYCKDNLSVLHIEQVTEEDDDEYWINARDGFEGRKKSDTLKIIVIGGNLKENI